MSETIELSGLNIQLRLQTPYDIVLTTGVNPGELSAETVSKALDMLTEVAEREKLKGELASLRATLRRNEEMLLTRVFEKQIADLRTQRAKYDADSARRWIASERRGPRKLSGLDQTKMEEFERQIEQVLKAKLEVENGILLTMWQVDCLQARIAGQAEPPMPEEITSALHELGVIEDVSFPQAA